MLCPVSGQNTTNVFINGCETVNPKALSLRKAGRLLGFCSLFQYAVLGLVKFICLIPSNKAFCLGTVGFFFNMMCSKNLSQVTAGCLRPQQR